MSTSMTSPPEGPSSAAPEVRWHFGQFIVWETQRRVERLGQGVRVGPRSFDLLLQLLKRAGEFVSKEHLHSTVWAGVVVEEGSVRVHMSTLRKALGEPAESDGCKEWISNVPHRGYRFNGRVRQELVGSSPQTDPGPGAPAFTKPPIRLTELVGRDADVAHVLASLATHRLLSIVGPGGIGKTSVAIRAAEQQRLKKAATQVAFVDLSPLTSQEHVLGTIARSFGVAADLPDVVQSVVQRLEAHDVVLLLDNCEHVLESLPGPITALLQALPGLRVLATSREALRVAGEYVLRLPALAVPNEEEATLAQALRWPSVKLLVERARAAGAGAFSELHGPLLARLAQQLDGIPLAIELVAARLGTQSLADLALRLDDHMRFYTSGNRSVLPRHKSLAAALDWSVALLDADELRLFRHLSVFRGRFDVESALAVAMDMGAEKGFDALISLANKSLVFFDGSDPIAPYRLLDKTRSYAAALLAQSGERSALLRRHATLMLDLMKAATEDLPILSEQGWAERYAHRVHDVRFAQEMCLTELRDASAAAALIAASAPLWFQLSQVEEYRQAIVATLALVAQQAEPDLQTATALDVALITALLHTGGSNEELNTACDRAVAGAIAVKSPELELRARWGRCTHDMFRGEYSAALRQSKELRAFVEAWPSPAGLVLSHRVSAMASHFAGAFDESRKESASALGIGSGLGRSHVNMVGPDVVVAAKALLCRTLWIQGETANALEEASDAVSRAEAIGHSVSLCAGLYGACPVALWAGEHELARKWVQMMIDHAQRKGLLGWLRYAEWYADGLRLAPASDRDKPFRDVSVRLAGRDAPCKEMLLTFCVDWLDDELIERVTRGESQWVAPEVWRAAGWRSERRGMSDEAETLYLRAIDTARQQGAVAWELRGRKSLEALRSAPAQSDRAAR